MSHPIELEQAPCPLGCAENDAPVLTGHDRLHHIPGEFNLVQCRTCGLLRTNPRPTPASMGAFYPDDYGPYLGTQILKDAKHPALLAIARKTLKWVINFRTHAIPDMAPGRLLEVGCAAGSYMQEMAKSGWVVRGIEFSQTAAQAAIRQGHQVHVGSLETAPPPDEPYDLIVGWMVLEHLHDPVIGLKKLRQWATNDGRLVLSVPNANSLEFRVFRDKWYALQLPTHLYHYTPRTIKQILHASGWEVEKVLHQRSLSNLIASIGYFLEERNHSTIAREFIKFPERGLFWHCVTFPLAWLLSMFGQTGRMTIWARVRQ